MSPVILLHGALGTSAQVQPLSDFLRQNGCEPYSFSFSGHGHNPFHPKDFGIRLFSEELQQFISGQGLVKPHVFGYSMGGYAALYLACKQPGLLGHIATLATKFAWDTDTVKKEINKLDAKNILLKVPEFAKALRNRHGEGWELLLQKTAGMMAELGNKNLITAEALAGIENKVMLGLGDSDAMVSLEETMDTRRGLKNGSLYLLPSTKHPLESVDIKVLGPVLLSFLS